MVSFHNILGKHPDLLQYTNLEDFKHKFKLSSAYAELNEPITNYTTQFQG